LISGTKGPPVPSKSKNARSGVFTQEQIKQKRGIGGGYRNIGQITTGSPRKAYFSGAFPTPGNYSNHKTGTGKSIFSYYYKVSGRGEDTEGMEAYLAADRNPETNTQRS